MATKVTQKIYDAVKILFENGATYNEVATFFHFSTATANSIKASETYEEYKHIAIARSGKVRAIKAKEKAKEYEQKQEEQRKQEEQKKREPKPGEELKAITGTVQIPFYITQEIKKQNELLTQISNKLAFIVEQLS